MPALLEARTAYSALLFQMDVGRVVFSCGHCCVWTEFRRVRLLEERTSVGIRITHVLFLFYSCLDASKNMICQAYNTEGVVGIAGSFHFFF